MSNLSEEELEALECCIKEAESAEEVELFEDLKEVSYGY